MKIRKNIGDGYTHWRCRNPACHISFASDLIRPKCPGCGTTQVWVGSFTWRRVKRLFQSGPGGA